VEFKEEWVSLPDDQTPFQDQVPSLKFLCVLSITNKIIVICTKVHLQMEINCKTHFWFL
jgi:hypothetical protein